MYCPEIGAIDTGTSTAYIVKLDKMIRFTAWLHKTLLLIVIMSPLLIITSLPIIIRAYPGSMNEEI